MLAAHLVKRFLGSFDRRAMSGRDLREVDAILDPEERALWNSMRIEDRRHSLIVLRRFVHVFPDHTRAMLAGVLLHDVGKIVSDLGPLGRVIATLCGPRGSRFQAYHDHESIGAALVAECGSAALTVEIIKGTCPQEIRDALRRADTY